MSWTLTTSQAAVVKAGINASPSITISGAILAEWYDQSEAMLNTLSRYDWTANYAALGANFKQILSDVVSADIAMKIVNYDTSGYYAGEAQLKLDYLRDVMTRGIEILKEDKYREVVT